MKFWHRLNDKGLCDRGAVVLIWFLLHLLQETKFRAWTFWQSRSSSTSRGGRTSRRSWWRWSRWKSTSSTCLTTTSRLRVALRAGVRRLLSLAPRRTKLLLSPTFVPSSLCESGHYFTSDVEQWCMLVPRIISSSPSFSPRLLTIPQYCFNICPEFSVLDRVIWHDYRDSFITSWIEHKWTTETLEMFISSYFAF